MRGGLGDPSRPTIGSISRMANRFDILISRIEQRAHGLPALHPIGDENGTQRDQRHAKPVGERKPLAQKDRAEHRHKHHA